MPRQQDYSEEQAKAILEDYVFPGECGASTLPTDMKPEPVSQFIRDRVDRKCDDYSMGRATRVVRFYALRDRVGQLLGLLQGGEQTPADAARTCSIIVTAGELGTAEEQQTAAKAFEKVLDGPAAPKALGVLIQTFFSLPPKTAVEPLRKRVHAALEDCRKNGPQERLGEYMDYKARRLPWMQGAKARRDFVVNMKPGPERMQRWAEAYLGFETETPFSWEEQAGFGLLAAAREEGDRPAVEALKAAMKRIDPDKDKLDLVHLRKTRAYRARLYFLDELNEDQKADMEGSARAQVDLIV